MKIEKYDWPLQKADLIGMKCCLDLDLKQTIHHWPTAPLLSS